MQFVIIAIDALKVVRCATTGALLGTINPLQDEVGT